MSIERKAEKAFARMSQADKLAELQGIYLCGEGRKRDDIRLPGDQEKFLTRLLAIGKPVILILFGGRTMVLNSLEAKCAAVIQAWYPGEEGGNALADVLLGNVNPSGKLCVSYPSVDDPAPLCYNNGYNASLSPLYPFGFGLSYTNYSYSELRVPASAHLSDAVIPISFKIQNTGLRAGTEIVQLYLSPKDSGSHSQPIRLKGFHRISLAPGEEKTVNFGMSPEQLCVWKDGSWVVEPGTYRVRVGASSTDLPLEAEVKIDGPRKVFAKRTHFFCD